MEQNQPACVSTLAILQLINLHNHALFIYLVIDCGNLTDPDRGQVTFTPGVVVTVETGLGADANYTCNEGYDLVGDALRTCEENGQWNGGEPSCMCK